MQDDLQKLSDKLDFDVAAHYPQTKHKFRTERKPARELLNEATRDLIYQNCRVEFDALGFDR